MRTKHSKTVKQTNVHIMYIMSLLGAVGLISIINLGYYNSTSALTYQTSVTNSFKIEPSVSISLSSSELTIDNLTPNSSKESNVLTITAESNSGGYTLYSTVGGSLENTTYASTDLQHKTNYDSSNDNTRFVNLASKVDYTKDGTNLTGGTWGYTFTTSADSDDAWEKFSGLPLNGSGDMAKLIDTDSPSTAAIKFKIAAAATDQQISGEYNNVINFIASPEYTPSAPAKTYMQDLTSTSIATLLPKVGSEATVVDSRDEQEYTIAKLKDGKYWMTTNLNLAGNTLLTSDKTDFDSSYSLPTNQGWQSDGKLPESSTSGFSNDNYAYVYNSGSTTCGNNSPCYSYYSWDATTLGSGRSISTDNANAPYSICPKGWHLPTTYNGADESTDFRALMIALGGSSATQTYNTSSNPTGATISSALQASPSNFLLAGYYYSSGSFYGGGSYGYYWSATSSSRTSTARFLYFGSTGVGSADSDSRRGGYSVRCVFGE